MEITTIKQLEQEIKSAKTKDYLKKVLDSIKLQDNGFKQPLYRRLDNAFWYHDLNTVVKIKSFMLKQLPFYSIL